MRRRYQSLRRTLVYYLGVFDEVDSGKIFPISALHRQASIQCLEREKIISIIRTEENSKNDWRSFFNRLRVRICGREREEAYNDMQESQAINL